MSTKRTLHQELTEGKDRVVLGTVWKKASGGFETGWNWRTFTILPIESPEDLDLGNFRLLEHTGSGFRTGLHSSSLHSFGEAVEIAVGRWRESQGRTAADRFRQLHQELDELQEAYWFEFNDHEVLDRRARAWVTRALLRETPQSVNRTPIHWSLVGKKDVEAAWAIASKVEEMAFLVCANKKDFRLRGAVEFFLGLCDGDLEKEEQ